MAECSGGINFETTENVFIEGDNLDALKLLQETYLNRVKLIYIDPPYNTGRDFIYKDKRITDEDEYLEDSEQIDEDGNYLVANPISNGRFHSDWLSFIYPRLKLARNLLRDDGVIFISIDDNEQANLKKLCDEIFGAENFIGNIIWARKRGKDNSAKFLSRNHEYALAYAKNILSACFGRLAINENTRKAYTNPDKDLRGDYRLQGIWARGSQGGSKYAFTAKNGQYFSERLWLVGPETMNMLDADNRLAFKGDNIYRKLFLSEHKGDIAETIWLDASNAANAADEIKFLFGSQIFDTVKPSPYISRMLQLATEGDDIILDFFAGSGTTAQAVMQLNAEDSGRRKFILVQLPEVIKEENTEFANIAEICKERIRRAGQMIKAGKYPDGRAVKDWKEPKNPDLDIGFRVFKIGSSNMQEDYYRLPQETAQNELASKADNIKPGRSAEDLLFQLFLEWGVPLSARIEKEEIDGKEILFVNKAEFEGIQTDMIACFDKGLTESLIMRLARLKPLRAVFRDHSFANDSLRENVEALFKQLSPETDLRVI